MRATATGTRSTSQPSETTSSAGQEPGQGCAASPGRATHHGTTSVPPPPPTAPALSCHSHVAHPVGLITVYSARPSERVHCAVWPAARSPKFHGLCGMCVWHANVYPHMTGRLVWLHATTDTFSTSPLQRRGHTRMHGPQCADHCT